MGYHRSGRLLQGEVRVPMKPKGLSPRHRAGEALATGEQRLRAIFDSASEFQILLDAEGRCLEANRAALEFAGIGMEAVRGKKLYETAWWAGSAAAKDRLREACAGAAAGHTIWYDAEWPVHGGRSLVDCSIKPVFDTDGKVMLLLAQGRGVRDSRRPEDTLRELEAESVMGRLAARVAHEINDSLAGIQNSFLLIKDAIPKTHPYYAYVDAIEREIGRISSVTRQLYETFRPDPDAGPAAATEFRIEIPLPRGGVGA